MTDAVVAQTGNVAVNLRRWQVLVIMVGFPVLYWINGFMPWSYGLFIQRDHGWFIPFGVSVCVLHWASFVVAMWFIKRAGGRPSDIGLHMGAGGMVLFVVVVAVVGGVLITLRHTWPINDEAPDDWQFFYPFTLAERCFFLFMALSAGFCEEVVYRGFAITTLKGRGWRTWPAVILATLSFIFIHGIAGLFMFPFLFVVGLLYAGLFLWRRSLTPGIYMHALFDVMGVAAI